MGETGESADRQSPDHALIQARADQESHGYQRYGRSGLGGRASNGKGRITLVLPKPDSWGGWCGFSGLDGSMFFQISFLPRK
jgi:hypothetical protein